MSRSAAMEPVAKPALSSGKFCLASEASLQRFLGDVEFTERSILLTPDAQQLHADTLTIRTKRYDLHTASLARRQRGLSGHRKRAQFDSRWKLLRLNCMYECVQSLQQHNQNLQAYEHLICKISLPKPECLSLSASHTYTLQMIVSLPVSAGGLINVVTCCGARAAIPA